MRYHCCYYISLNKYQKIKEKVKLLQKVKIHILYYNLSFVAIECLVIRFYTFKNASMVSEGFDQKFSMSKTLRI